MTLREIERTVRNGRGEMPPFADTLTPQQISMVAAYAREVAQSPAPAAGEAVPPSQGDGRAPAADASPAAVFNAHCARCHGEQGTLVPGWRDTVRGMSISQIEETIRKGKDGMPSFAGKLPDSQIHAAAVHAKRLAAK